MTNVITITKNETAPTLKFQVNFVSGRKSHHKTLESAIKAIKKFAGDAPFEDQTGK